MSSNHNGEIGTVYTIVNTIYPTNTNAKLYGKNYKIYFNMVTKTLGT